MAYTALYRKYRPQHFSDVVGQPVTIQILNNALKNDRISHAYLFSGPRGTGKTTAAKIFARALNCTGENKPCGECDNCRMAMEQNHPDIIEIDAASNNGVDEVRNLIDQIRYSPIEGKYKIFIIDEVHMMSQGAFNALLKTIEEPPEYVIFILATTEPYKVLPTVLSRCLQFEFTKVSQPLIEARLQKVCQEEGISYDQQALSLIASLSDGGLRDALSILDQCISYDQQITLQSVETVFGLTSREELLSLLSKVSKESIDESIRQLEDLYNQGKDLKQLVQSLIGILKEILLYQLDPNSSLLSEESKKVLQTSLPDLSSSQIQGLLDDLISVSSRLASNQTTLIRLETILLKNSISDRIDQISDQIYTESQKEDSSERSEKNLKPKNNVSEIPRVSPKKQETSIKTVSAVSRETQKFVPVESEWQDVNLESLLPLLVQASKDQKEKDQAIWNTLTQDTSSLQEERLAHSLSHSRIVASSANQILVQTPNIRQAQHINALQSQIGFEDFFQKRLQVPKSVFAVTGAQAKELVALFRERGKAGTLPVADSAAVLPVSSKVSKEEKLKKMLPGLEVIDD